MSTLTVAIPDELDAMLSARASAAGAGSKEKYLLALLEWDCAAGSLDETLLGRMAGPFEPLEEDWKQRVRDTATKLAAQ
jgi:hypothetical protein